MPYIKQSQRENLNPAIDELVNRVRVTCEQDKDQPDGMLNYAMTSLLLGTVAKDKRYFNLERAVGCLECCKLELYRRVAAPYENVKAKENGDVFDYIEGGQLK